MFTKFLGLINELVSIYKSFLTAKKYNKRWPIFIAIIAVLAVGVVIIEQFASKSKSETLVNNNITIIQNINNYYESDYAGGENTSSNDGTNNCETLLVNFDDEDEMEAADSKSNFRRNTYSLQQASEGAMVEAVTFNSYKITDSDEIWYKEMTGEEIPQSTLRNETNFVGARVNNGINAGKDNIWEGTEIVAEDGQTYIVRLYIHNNGDDIAEGTKVRFYVPYGSSDTMIVDGWLTSSNAEPDTYSDTVTFKSKDGSYFRLEYVEGSALLENGGMAKGAGKALPDNITNQGNPTNSVNNEWITIGYDDFNGKIPGGYKYINYVSIQVKVAYD